jgi:hypothetical protein
MSSMEHARRRLGKDQVVRWFSPEEDLVIERMRVDGAGTTAIARHVTARFGKPRSPATINMRLKTLAMRDDGL